MPEHKEFLSAFFAAWHSESSYMLHTAFMKVLTILNLTLVVMFIELPLINLRMLLIH